MSAPEIFLLDNGSLRPEATLTLRELAVNLSQRSGFAVQAVSLLHANKVDPSELDGIPARIVKPSFRAAVESGKRRFVFLPLFLGPSRAITDYLAGLIAAETRRVADLQVAIAEPLAGFSVERPDDRLAEILADQVRTVMEIHGLRQPKVALVDHGTPVERVNRLRNTVARQMAALLADEVAEVIACSMERRPGREYAFNEPLLEGLGSVDHFAGGALIAAMFFLLPGRHAGAGGDVAEICDQLRESGAFERVVTTSLVGTHPVLLDILADRLRAALRDLEA